MLADADANFITQRIRRIEDISVAPEMRRAENFFRGGGHGVGAVLGGWHP